MATFEFGWVGLLLVMISGGFGAVGMLPLLGIGPDTDDAAAAFVVFFLLLSSAAAIAAATF